MGAVSNCVNTCS